ncbi:response regulator [Vagococcus sp. PNs007]|uniref:Response regulator n=1 Tax=Vagococcus proximus TaxID=2991417 RepID=A0ABT5X2W6_9ENTE|nr:response regulator [Vagococcus proximus]MDF0480348.1 response regulator [Vagococcus proximus]
MYKVLVVEDEKIIRKGIVYGFDYAKYNCLVVGEASNGQIGIEMIRELNPDIVISDINMPVKNAFDMLEETQDMVYSTIIISGVNEFKMAQQAIKFGVTEFLLKPLDMDKLALSIKKAIEHKEMQSLYHEQLSAKNCALSKEVLVFQKQEMTDELVLEMIHYIETHYGEKITLEELEHELNYSKSVLQARFKKATHYTFNEFMNRYRIQKAVEMIKNKHKVYEIASACGFKEYKYFNKVFNKYTGMCVSDFASLVE